MLDAGSWMLVVASRLRQSSPSYDAESGNPVVGDVIRNGPFFVLSSIEHQATSIAPPKQLR
jgi:hypothetical protein